jgi:hypothetical protein
LPTVGPFDAHTSYGRRDRYHVPAETEHAALFATDSAEIEFWFAR